MFFFQLLSAVALNIFKVTLVWIFRHHLKQQFPTNERIIIATSPAKVFFLRICKNQLRSATTGLDTLNWAPSHEGDRGVPSWWPSAHFFHQQGPCWSRLQDGGTWNRTRSRNYFQRDLGSQLLRSEKAPSRRRPAKPLHRQLCCFWCHIYMPPEGSFKMILSYGSTLVGLLEGKGTSNISNYDPMHRTPFWTACEP